MSPSASMPISWCMLQTPQIFVTCQTSPRALLLLSDAGFTFNFLKLYSPQFSHGCDRAMRSARASEIDFDDTTVNLSDRCQRLSVDQAAQVHRTACAETTTRPS